MPSKRQQKAAAELAALQAGLAKDAVPHEEEAPRPRQSAFAALEATEEDVKSEDESQAAEQPVAATASKSSRKKRKKAKTGTPMDAEAAPKLDEIDQALLELGLSPASAAAPPIASTSSTSKDATAVQLLRSLLAVDPKHLDPDAELRRMFGARVVNASRANQPASPAGRQARKLPKHPSHLSKPLPFWPPINMVKFGVSMEVNAKSRRPFLSAEDEIWYTFVHSKGYKESQAAFLAAVQSNDVGQFFALLQQSPFHIDTLMALSDMALMQGDAGRSDEFVEQALYAFEYAQSTGFSLSNGSARLNFLDIENRAMFRALDRKVASLAKRGCWRTAFETARVLFQLDPYSDPWGSLLHLEFLAPKAGQGRWFIQLFETYASAMEKAGQTDDPKAPHLRDMPGMQFSKALCMFDLEEEAAKSGEESEHKDSSEALVSAILVFPYLGARLAEKIGVTLPEAFTKNKRAQIKDSWQRTSQDMYLHLLAALYVERCSALWKPPEIMSWLQKALSTATPLLDSTFNADAKYGHLLPSIIQYHLEPDEDMPPNFVRHVVFSGFDTLRPLFPPNVLASVGNSFDPLPPAEGTSYDHHYFEGVDVTKRLPTRAAPMPAENGVGILQQLQRAAEQMGDMNPEERAMFQEQVAAMAEEQSDEDIDPEERGLLRNALARFLGNFWPAA